MEEFSDVAETWIIELFFFYMLFGAEPPGMALGREHRTQAVLVSGRDHILSAGYTVTRRLRDLGFLAVYYV